MVRIATWPAESNTRHLRLIHPFDTRRINWGSARLRRYGGGGLVEGLPSLRCWTLGGSLFLPKPHHFPFELHPRTDRTANLERALMRIEIGCHFPADGELKCIIEEIN
jgi:hypothetical protein